MAALVVLEAVVIALLAVLVAGLLRSHADILRALHELGVSLDPDGHESGSPTGRAGPLRIRTSPGVPAPGGDRPVVAPDLVGVTASGETAQIPVGGHDGLTLLAFLTTGCATCRSFWDAFRDGRPEGLPAGVRPVVVTRGPEAEDPDAVAALAPASLPTLSSSEAWDAYGIPVAPYFVLVDGRDGRIVGEGAGATWGQVVALLAKAAAETGLGASTRRSFLTGGAARARAERADAELRAAGIEPGDPRLHPPVAPGGER